jgi:hypothetical protein
MLADWTRALAEELHVDIDVDVNAVLDLARDAAHSVTRPAAPVSTFLAGFAAAQAGGSPEDITRALDTAQLLALRWGQDGDTA